MWDSPLYAMNMFYYHWNKKATSAYSRAEYSQAGKDIYIERGGRVREMPCSCQRRKMPAGSLPESHSLMAIYRLIEMD